MTDIVSLENCVRSRQAHLSYAREYLVGFVVLLLFIASACIILEIEAWDRLYWWDKVHYDQEIVQTLCKVTAWNIREEWVENNYGDGGKLKQHFELVLSFPAGIHGGCHYDYASTLWLDEPQYDPNSATQFGKDVSAPPIGSSITCWYQRDDPCRVELSNQNNPPPYLYWWYVLAVAILVITSLIGAWSCIRTLCRCYPYYRRYKEAQHHLSSAQIDLIRHTEAKRCMQVFLLGTHPKLGQGSSIQALVDNDLYDPNLLKVITLFLGYRCDLPPIMRNFRISRSDEIVLELQ